MDTTLTFEPLSLDELQRISAGGWRDDVDKFCELYGIGTGLAGMLLNHAVFYIPASFCAGWKLSQLIG